MNWKGDRFRQGFALNLSLLGILALGGEDQKLIASPFGRNTGEVARAFGDVVAQANRSTAVILCDGKQAALGAIVDSNGFILTKASELHGKVECRLSGRASRKQPGAKTSPKTYRASLVGVHHETDLAMLKINASNLPPIKWRPNDSPPVGSWLATTGIDRQPTAVGVVSAAARPVAARRGVLGVELDEGDPDRPGGKLPGPRVKRVLAASAAKKAGLQVDDIVLEVNSAPTADPRTVIDLVKSHRPGDHITLRILRGKKHKLIWAVLGDRFSPRPMNRNEFQNHLGSRLSSRRGGFPLALQHDSVLAPHECGGPIVGLDGRAIGLNIARAGRVASFALPFRVIQPLLADLKSGRYAMVAYLKEVAEQSPSETVATKKEAN